MDDGGSYLAADRMGLTVRSCTVARTRDVLRRRPGCCREGAADATSRAGDDDNLSAYVEVG